ncbi:hypothetical protein CWC17_13515 [Pseudoalteromonas sp. S3785]|nr:hypothetical protein CWC17_13515 [Pseudoalteromonas sp. S3785]
MVFNKLFASHGGLVKIKRSEVEVLEDNPFKNDELGRQESSNVLTQFVKSSTEPLVLCIDAPWGQGKTTFLRMWEQQLKNENIPTIYFNAWENDFTDDALISLLGEISSSIESISKAERKDKVKEYLDKTKKLGVSLLKRSVPVAAKIATAGALDLDKVTEQALASFAESVAKEQLDRYEQSKATIVSFRTALADLASNISSQTDKKPLVFIIDELDRCRPNFSIEILEKAKHFFSVENIIFVLGADKDQLGHSIKSVYGDGIDVHGYLRRFIDVDYVLPTPNKGLYAKALFNKHGFNEYFKTKTESETKYEGEQALVMFTELFEIYNLSLREQGHCCSLLSISIKTSTHEERLYPLFLCFLIVLKIKKPTEYKNFINERLTPEDLLTLLKSNELGVNLLSTNYGMSLEAYLMCCKSFSHDTHEINAKYELIKTDLDSSAEEKKRAGDLIKRIDHFDWNGGVGILRETISKIEIASRFSG